MIHCSFCNQKCLFNVDKHVYFYSYGSLKKISLFRDKLAVPQELLLTIEY